MAVEIWDGMFIVIMLITPLIQDSSLCVYAVNLPPLIPCTTRLCETAQEEPISVTRHRAWSTHWQIWINRYMNIQPWDVTIHSCPNEVRHGWLIISHWKLLVWLLTSTLSNLSIAMLVKEASCLPVCQMIGVSAYVSCCRNGHQSNMPHWISTIPADDLASYCYCHLDELDWCSILFCG